MIEELNRKGIIATSQDEIVSRMKTGTNIEKIDFEIIHDQFRKDGWRQIPKNKSTEGTLYVKI